MNQNPPQPPRKHKFSELFYNGTTYCGVILAVTMFLVEAFLIFLEFSDHGSNVYLGIITYVVLPIFLILGLLLIAIGALRKRSRILKGLAESKPFVFDFSEPRHRNGLIVFVAGTTILLVMSVIGAYKAYHYTESVEFCGTMCHQVMEPEHTTYLNSPHARVKCVECHIGPGAGWYVKSKMSGVRQVFATLRNSYSRPIETPVHDLRPSKDTCEQCHWPGKSYSAVEFNKTYYGLDSNQKWQLRMLMNISGRDGKVVGEGIHAHMYIDHDIYYVADDRQRQEITWIKSVSKDGTERIYTSPESPYAATPPPAEKIRKMDCIDCHNRPTHIFENPERLLNRAMDKGLVDIDLPGIKSKAVELMNGSYKTVAQAEEAIRQGLQEHYQKELGDGYAEKSGSVDKAAEEVIAMYRKNFFPLMNVRWDTHPDNIGHVKSAGCFRCHDGQHADAQGVVVTRDCKVCHTIIEQGAPGEIEKNTDGLEFRHPFEDDGLWQEMSCIDCHRAN